MWDEHTCKQVYAIMKRLTWDRKNVICKISGQAEETISVSFDTSLEKVQTFRFADSKNEWYFSEGKEHILLSSRNKRWNDQQQSWVGSNTTFDGI